MSAVIARVQTRMDCPEGFHDRFVNSVSPRQFGLIVRPFILACKSRCTKVPGDSGLCDSMKLFGPTMLEMSSPNPPTIGNHGCNGEKDANGYVEHAIIMSSPCPHKSRTK
jgi:hypothetical protein